MRTEYIKFIKEYILQQPNYNTSLSEIKSSVLATGATEEEFEEALRQLALSNVTFSKTQEPQTVNTTKPSSPQQTQSLSKKLVEFDIAAHAILILIILASGIFIATSTNLPAVLLLARTGDLPSPQQTQEEQKQPPRTILNPAPLYANSKAIDAKEVFSYPASNITLTVKGIPQREVFGFFPYWMLEESEKVSLDMLTSMSLFGLEVDGGGKIITRYADGQVDGGWQMWNDDKLDALIARARKKRVKIHLTLKCFDNDNIEKLVKNDESQKTFIANALQLVQSKNLDGVNIDFEYVGEPPSQVRDGFTRLLANLSHELKRQIPTASLSVDTYINAAATLGLFDVSQITDYADVLIVMGYDVHTPKGLPGPIAPMEGTVGIINLMQSYLEKIPSSKLILAVAYYGYDWPVVGNERVGDAAIVPYAEIAQASKHSKIYWNETTQAPWYRYITDQNQMREVHFENARSLGIKFDYINEKNLRGIGIWALGYDGLNKDLQALLVEKFTQ